MVCPHQFRVQNFKPNLLSSAPTLLTTLKFEGVPLILIELPIVSPASQKFGRPNCHIQFLSVHHKLVIGVNKKNYKTVSSIKKKKGIQYDDKEYVLSSRKKERERNMYSVPAAQGTPCTRWPLTSCYRWFLSYLIFADFSSDWTVLEIGWMGRRPCFFEASVYIGYKYYVPSFFYNCVMNGNLLRYGNIRNPLQHGTQIALKSHLLYWHE